MTCPDMFYWKDQFELHVECRELQYLEFLLVGGVGGSLGLHLIYGNLDLFQQQMHLGGLRTDV